MKSVKIQVIFVILVTRPAKVFINTYIFVQEVFNTFVLY